MSLWSRVRGGVRSMPPELDDLAWRVAEEDSIAAHLEFAKRHPEFADEIARRVESVRTRREAGETVPPRPLRWARRRRPLPAGVPILVGLIAGSVGFAIVVLRAPARFAPPVSEARRSADEAPTPPAAPPPSQTASPAPVAAAPNVPPVPVGSPVAGSERPTTLRLTGTPLLTALALVAEAGGFRLRTEGDIPNPEIEATLADMTPRTMISTLAERYGVAAREEAPGSFVVSPLPEFPGSP